MLHALVATPSRRWAAGMVFWFLTITLFFLSSRHLWSAPVDNGIEIAAIACAGVALALLLFDRLRAQYLRR